MNTKKTLVAACGLFCPSCAIYIASHEDEGRLKEQANFLGTTPEETYCKGCKSEKGCKTCGICFILKCTAQKGIDFCSECNDYPCAKLIEFQSVMPHRIELWKDLQTINKNGYEHYYAEVESNYRCPNCRTINSGWT